MLAPFLLIASIDSSFRRLILAAGKFNVRSNGDAAIVEYKRVRRAGRGVIGESVARRVIVRYE